MPKSLPVFVGLDYHQDSVQVCVLDARGRQLLNRPVANEWQAIARSVEPLGKVKRVGIESCGGAADLAEELVERAGWSVALALRVTSGG
jgi:transposase